MTPEQVRAIELDVAIFLHKQRHRSAKTLCCNSDLALAEDIVDIVLRGKPDEDDQR